MSDQTCQYCQCSRRPGVVGRFLKTTISVLLLYVAMLFGSGTLISTGNPIATEIGRLMQVVLFVEPTIRWAEHNDHRILASGIERISEGVTIG